MPASARETRGCCVGGRQPQAGTGWPRGGPRCQGAGSAPGVPTPCSPTPCPASPLAAARCLGSARGPAWASPATAPQLQRSLTNAHLLADVANSTAAQRGCASTDDVQPQSSGCRRSAGTWLEATSCLYLQCHLYWWGCSKGHSTAQHRTASRCPAPVPLPLSVDNVI